MFGVLVVCFDWFSRVWFSLVLGGVGRVGPVLLFVGGRVFWPGSFGVVSGGRVRLVASCCFVVRGGRLSWLFGVVVCSVCFGVVGGFRVFFVLRAGVLPGFVGLGSAGSGGVSCGCGFVFRPVALLFFCWGVRSGWVGVLLRFFRLVVRPPGLPSLVVGGGCLVLSGRLVLFGEFDPGSGRTLAACLTHASRTGLLLLFRGGRVEWRTGEYHVSNLPPGPG